MKDIQLKTEWIINLYFIISLLKRVKYYLVYINPSICIIILFTLYYLQNNIQSTSNANILFTNRANNFSIIFFFIVYYRVLANKFLYLFSNSPSFDKSQFLKTSPNCDYRSHRRIFFITRPTFLARKYKYFCRAKDYSLSIAPQ